MFARRGHKPSRKPPYQGHNRVADQVCDPGGGEPLAHSVSMPARLHQGCTRCRAPRALHTDRVMPRARCAAAPSGSLWQGMHFYAT